MKTKIFKLDRLSKTDIQTLKAWLKSLRWVWNEGLRHLEDLDTFTAAYFELVDGKKIWHRAPCCPVPWQYRRINKDEPWGDGNITPYTYMARKRPYAQFCPITPSQTEIVFEEVNRIAQAWIEAEGCVPTGVAESSTESKRYVMQIDPKKYEPYTWKQPALKNSTAFGLAGHFAHKRHLDKPWLAAIPANFIRGVTASLAKAWEKYKSGKGGKPRFKRHTDVSDTLINEDAKKIIVTQLNPRDGLIRIPKLGVFRVKHLWADWGDRQISVLKIAKRPDGWYLQLTGDFESQPVRQTALVCELTAPDEVCDILGTHGDKQIQAYTPDPKLLRRKELLQQQMARQEKHRGKNWQKTKRKIAAIDKRMAEQAKNHNQKISTFLIRTYGAIHLNGVGQRRVLRKPKKNPRAKTFNPIHYDPNGAERIAAYNQRVASQRGGQFVALLKQKGKTHDRVVEVNKPD